METEKGRDACSAVSQPPTALTRHAEIEALRALPLCLRARYREMTLYTPLESCHMCARGILLHHIGHLVSDASDPYGGVVSCLDSPPSYYEREFSILEWVGPALPPGNLVHVS